MPLITPEEVSTLAFFNALDSDFVLPAFISSAETRYIIPLVTPAVVTAINASPSGYTTLLNDYIKPYLAFCIKYMFYNQLLTETESFPTSDAQRTAALNEVLSIMEVLRSTLSDYLNASIFATPVVISSSLHSGFLTSSASTSASSASSSSTTSLYDITSMYNASSTGMLSNAYTFNFLNTDTGLLNKITWANLKLTLREYFGSIATKQFWTGTQAAYDALGTYDSGTIYFVEDD